MIERTIDRIRYASPAFWRCLMVCGVILAALYSVLAQARWKPEYGTVSPEVQAWFRNQHNAAGQWCCDKSDGHEYDGNYSFNADGSVTVDLAGKPHVIPKHMVLTGPNPTGHAVWWYTTDYDGARRTYCFAPGTLS